MKSSFLFFLSSSLILWVNASPGPEINVRARVKQHRAGQHGDLVEGEEELRKIIVSWANVEGYVEYEVCHNCEFSADGELIEGEASSANDTCGGLPCYVKPGAPIGYNTFRVRVKTGEGWSEWGTQGRYNVGEVGHAEHDEL